MAIAYDSSSSGVGNTVSSLTFAHTCTGTGLFLTVAVNTYTNTATGVTYAGVPMTLIYASTEGDGRPFYVYGLIGPSTGTNNVVINTTGGLTFISAVSGSYTGVYQGGQPEVVAHSGTASLVTSYNQSITTLTDNAWGVWMVGGKTGTVTAGAGTTKRISSSADPAGYVATLLDGNGGVTPIGVEPLALTQSSASAVASVIIALGTTLPLPVTSTQAVTSIGVTTATGNGTITSDNGAVVTQRGIVWSTSTNPTTSDFKSAVSGTVGVFTAPMTGLTPGTLYYVRAYGISANGTAYGAQVSFTSLLVATNTVYKDIDGIEGETYAVRMTVGGTLGSVTISLGSTGSSATFAAGAGVSTFQGVYGGSNGVTIVASPTFNGYIDDFMYVLVLGTATIDWNLDMLTNFFPINSSVLFKRIEDSQFDRFRIYRYLDVQFKDQNAYVTVMLKKEANEDLTESTKQFLVSNVSGQVLPFINKRISMLTKNYGMRLGVSHNRLDETFTICQFVVSGTEQQKKLFSSAKIISI